MTDLSTIRLFATHPHDCSYLEDETATTVFVDPQYPITKEIYGRLSQKGFRRSGNHLYRPHCEACKACIAARIPVSSFTMSRQQRRCWNRNQDLIASCAPTIDTDEHLSLYNRYIELRHRDGDMYPPSKEQYQSFLSSEWGVTEYIDFRLDGQLVAVAVCDRINDGYSAVYTFFEPTMDRRSLGVFAILWQIHLTRSLELDHVYLGYWIKNCSKMAYKTQYRPLQMLINQRWLTIR